MIRQDIDVDGYWKIIVCYNVYLGDYNQGFTHTNYGNRLSIVGIGKATSKEQFINTIVHEAKHVQTHICNYYDVSEDSEQAAYLIGFIVMRMFKIFKCLLR